MMVHFKYNCTVQLNRQYRRTDIAVDNQDSRYKISDHTVWYGL